MVALGRAPSAAAHGLCLSPRLLRAELGRAPLVQLSVLEIARDPPPVLTRAGGLARGLRRRALELHLGFSRRALAHVAASRITQSRLAIRRALAPGCRIDGPVPAETGGFCRAFLLRELGHCLELLRSSRHGYERSRSGRRMRMANRDLSSCGSARGILLVRTVPRDPEIFRCCRARPRRCFSASRCPLPLAPSPRESWQPSRRSSKPLCRSGARVRSTKTFRGLTPSSLPARSCSSCARAQRTRAGLRLR